jgi:hypothetical protein
MAREWSSQLWTIPVESAELMVVDPCYVLREDEEGKPVVEFGSQRSMRLKVPSLTVEATCKLERRRLYPGPGGLVAGLAIRLDSSGATGKGKSKQIKEAVAVDSGTVLVIDPAILRGAEGELSFEDALPPDGQPCGIVLRPPTVANFDNHRSHSAS